MKIFNVMFSKVNGGLEQVFLNYTPTLTTQGNEVIPIIHPRSQIRSQCSHENLVLVHNFNQYDFVAIWRLKRLIQKERPDCIIMHSYRAAYLLKKTNTKVPKIAVCHVQSHYNFGADALIAITDSMRQDIIRSGYPPERVFTVPNMLMLPAHITYTPPRETDEPVIGVCARFSANKGVDVFLHAVAELKKRKIKFKAKIAGSGKEWETYRQLIHTLEIAEQVTLLGWIEDRYQFYQSLDIFCLPSREEAFGLVILEAMQYGLPMVLSELSGPKEILNGTQCALFVQPGNAMQMADGLEKLIKNPTLAHQFSYNAFQRVQEYSSEKVGLKLQEVLTQICKQQ